MQDAASPKIVPCLWFDFNAEEAVNHYLEVFGDGEILDLSRYGEANGDLNGKVLTIRFRLFGQIFLALNAGPQFPFTPAISLMVDCTDQAEVDRWWTALTAEGKESQCGWLSDKFGLSWQLVPTGMIPLLSDPDPAKSARVMAAMMQMQKIDLSVLQAAYDAS